MNKTLPIPSTERWHSRGLDPARLRVISYGTPRSASLWMFRVLCELCPEGGVIKTHAYLGLDSLPAVATYRDFRDSAVSAWRSDCERDTPPRLAEQMSMEEIVRYAGEARQWATHLRMYRHRPNTLIYCYRDGFSRDNAKSTIEELMDFLELPRSRLRICLIANRNSLSRAQREFRFAQLHPDDDAAPTPHCHEGQVAGWRRFVSPYGARLMNEILHTELLEFGYTP